LTPSILAQTPTQTLPLAGAAVSTISSVPSLWKTSNAWSTTTPPDENVTQTRDVEAWRLFQEGRYFFNRMETPSSNWKAIERYRQAIVRDPKFAQAYAGMADAYAYRAENFAVAPNEVMPKAREAAEKALALDDSSADAHVSLGLVKLDSTAIAVAPSANSSAPCSSTRGRRMHGTGTRTRSKRSTGCRRR
jgi:hypothetical protein